MSQYKTRYIYLEVEYVICIFRFCLASSVFCAQIAVVVGCGALSNYYSRIWSGKKIHLTCLAFDKSVYVIIIDATRGPTF